MTTPELLGKVGFEKTKVGHGDKETGYQIKESSLGSLVGSAFLCFLVMGLMVMSMVFDVHFERKTLHRQLRAEEHHAVSKLAQVQMELWSQYHEDIKESHEAEGLLKSMNASYNALQGQLQNAVHEISAELSLNPVKAEKFADKILHMVADMQKDNIKHAKHLVDHLVAVGKRSVKLEKHVDKEMVHELKEEQKHLKEDKSEGIDVAKEEQHKKDVTGAIPHKGKAGAAEKGAKDAKDEEEGDPLKDMLLGFFTTFRDFEGEFKGKTRKILKDGNPVYEQIKKLHKNMTERMQGEEPIPDEDLQAELDKIDLASVGAGLGSGRVLPVADVIDEIFLIPKVPFEKIDKLEKKWKNGEIDSVDLFEQLQELHETQVIPSGWLQMGVDNMEKDEAEAEADEEESPEEEASKTEED